MDGNTENSTDVRGKSIFKSLKRQAVSKVLDFSSQYGSEDSRSYTVDNIVGETHNYPDYGDFTQALVFRTYGTWWNQCPSTPKYFQYTNFNFISQDFIDIQFNEAVYPTEVEIYETYNPGAVVRILAFDSDSSTTNVYNRWFVLWSGNIQRCKRQARVFTPKLKKCPFKSRRLRLEFNQNHVDYYTELDAVYLHGVDSKEEYFDNEDSVKNLSDIFRGKIALNSVHDEVHGEQVALNILMLPIEVINKIFSYLTFTDFGNLSRSCRSLRNYCYDPLWFKEFDLQPYWQKVNDVSLHYLGDRCQSAKKIRLSWCGSNNMLSSPHFSRFLQKISGRLRCLYLSCCRFVDHDALQQITKVCPKLEELDLSSCIDIPSEAFKELARLQCLKRLNLYRTQITKIGFEKIARSCTELMHVNLGGCFKCENYDEMMKYLENCPNIVSLDLWRTKSLTANGIVHIFQNCPNLEEIDLGWCSNVATHGCLRLLVTHCPKIKKIFLTALRTVLDDDLIAISENCTMLEQLDILGNSNVTKKSAERILEECKNLKFFDVSFCSQLDDDWYRAAKERYPLVDLKKSVQNVQPRN
ncbi:F-box/LRR-repeat protein 4-like [Dendronephthya gigantea]|uniref:F-box/LRR-repeat protein 4-like n=1 Tax=Dendronephthya gigantea TaxID=151771 RepID=UPI00106A42D6|nr:F-box/LRR-repeat protein 4-like [Dendronephthya gigantea]